MCRFYGYDVSNCIWPVAHGGLSSRGLEQVGQNRLLPSAPQHTRTHTLVESASVSVSVLSNCMW